MEAWQRYDMHRYLDPATGRFLIRDPIGFEGGINLYAYVGNGVVMGADPIGFGVVNCDERAREIRQRVREILKSKAFYDKHGCLDKNHTKELGQLCPSLVELIDKFRKHCYKHPNYDKLLSDEGLREAYSFCRDWGRQRGWQIPEYLFEPGLRECTVELCAVAGLVGGAVRVGVICYRVGQQAVKCSPNLLRALAPQRP
jgi:hypothetical protein